MTGVMRRKKKVSFSSRSVLLPVGQRKSDGGVEIFYVILDTPPFLPPPCSFTFQPLFFF